MTEKTQHEPELAISDALRDAETERGRLNIELADARKRLVLEQTYRSECEKICAELRGMLADAKDRADRAETGNAQMTADLAAAREYAEALARELWAPQSSDEPGPNYRGIGHDTRFERPQHTGTWAMDRYGVPIASNVSGPVFVSDKRSEPDAIVAHPLYPVLVAAIDQCMRGKGQRHGGCEAPFMDQSWRELARVHGRGFLTGQAGKKLDEAVRRRLTGEPFEREALGAIVYIGMSILWDREMCAEGGAE